ncbi:M14 family metallopeptidase [Sphingomonas qomolangmaensis]|uniref:M14-type cytosolic carboxypeptidase n=1 Tax=Sphingomonas qomolangmaensis TaxID=2918765 RepID=A0ABY5LAS6_9SPHN|nr:M14-type cytosolic carboxypeptidase [Sphingomonas qomolangmaensis]UUL81796.1 M14-type cytosolic carboxypeptidase [Sphingomonas qomolangmaensis]
MTIEISAAFDSGNIELVGIEGDRVDLEIRRDAHSDFFQWFHFRVSGAADRTLTFRILNAGKAAYAFGWPGYRARVSTDQVEWPMTDTSYADGVLSFTHRFEGDAAWFAYFAPYSMDRHRATVARIAAMPGVSHRSLGNSLDGQPIDCLRIGDGPKQVWFYARQHPGESMAEWFMEGLLEKLTDPDDAVARALREKVTLHCVPNMNPDGSARGHLRTNAAGVNLNREWHAPTLDRSPEVLAVRDAMDATGVTFAMDVHGDEAIPANFIAGFEGIASWTDAHGAKFYDYGRRLAANTPLFQTERGYEKSAPGRANLSMSTNQLAERFGAVSMTLEMPFKDHDPSPDPVYGWSPDRSKQLAHACLVTLAEVIDTL